jgi:HAD superfamily hydrolase (TIGR01450 family)
VTWAVDLDGVVWLAGRAIPGSAEAVAALRSAGERVVFLTNNSGPLIAEHLEALSRVGVDCPPDDLTTSAQAAASMLGPGSSAAVIGAAGIHEALQVRGVKIVRTDESPDALVVGRSVELDYWALAAAAAAVRDGARFVATNTDATFPVGSAGGHRAGTENKGAGTENKGDQESEADEGTNGHGRSQGHGGNQRDDGTTEAEHAARSSGVEGLLPGAGALVAFIATASGRRPEVAGKPEAPMAALVKQRYGRLSVVAGDRPDTDGLFAKTTAAKFALVLSGVTRQSDLPVKPVPDLVGADLLSVVEQFLAARS